MKTLEEWRRSREAYNPTQALCLLQECVDYLNEVNVTREVQEEIEALHSALLLAAKRNMFPLRMDTRGPPPPPTPKR